jgi:hypothetical protein
MTTEQLTAYLQDDSYLYAVSYEELKTLVMQYPYATNLRILLLKKSFLEQNKDYDRNLQMAATFTTNRKYLYQVVQKVKSFQSAPQSVILGEDYLELTELSNIEKLLAEKQVADALGSASEFDNLAADWQLEFGNLETAEEANTEPKIKGRDEEEIEMFELAFGAQVVENQPVENEDDLNYLIGNIVSEYKTEDEPTIVESTIAEPKVIEPETTPSVKTLVYTEKSFFDLIEFPVETAAQPVVAIAEPTFESQIITSEPIVEAIVETIEPPFELPIFTPESIVEAIEMPLELPIITKQTSLVKSTPPAIDFFELIGQKTAESATETVTNSADIPFEIVSTMDASSENVVTIESKNADITEEEMDALLSNSFKFIVKEDTDDLMATSFAVMKGVHPDTLDEHLAYSFVEEGDIKKAITPVVEVEIKAAVPVIDDLATLEADFDKQLKSKTLAPKIEAVVVVPTIGEVVKEVVVKPATIVKRIVSKEVIEAELANKAAIKLEKEITREAPSHSFRVIKKQLANEVAANSFKVVVKEKPVLVNEPLPISVQLIEVKNEPSVVIDEFVEAPKVVEVLPIIEEVAPVIQELSPVIEEVAPIIEEIAPIEMDEVAISTKISDLFAAIDDNEIDESMPIFEFIDEIPPIIADRERFEDIKAVEAMGTSKKIEEIKVIEEGLVSSEHDTTPQYIRNLEDILPVFKQKLDSEEKKFEKDYTESKKKTPTQSDDELDEILATFDNKTDETEEMNATKKAQVELPIFKEEPVKKDPTPVAESPSDNMSFTEWLRQYRMSQAAAAAEAAAYGERLKESDTYSEVFDNQAFIEKEANRKSIKQNLDALFEMDSDVPDNLFGLADDAPSKPNKALNTEGATDLIRQHLTLETNEDEPVSTEKKKKKKKKEMHELAARSIQEDDEMVSETLADLLMWQGKTTKAVDMYRKLSLAFPDKSAYFASKIETIKSATV